MPKTGGKMKMWELRYMEKEFDGELRHTALEIWDEDGDPIIIMGASAGYGGEEGDNVWIITPQEFTAKYRYHRTELEKSVAIQWLPKNKTE